MAVLEKSRDARILGTSVRFKSALRFSIKLYKQVKVSVTLSAKYCSMFQLSAGFC